MKGQPLEAALEVPVEYNTAKPSPLTHLAVERRETFGGFTRMKSQLEGRFHCEAMHGPCFNGLLRSLQILPH
jgi:hypothetical protein